MRPTSASEAFVTEVRVQKLSPDAKIPAYAKIGDAGADLYSNETVSFSPGEHRLVSTSIAMAVPKGHVGLIKDRSSLAAKHALHCLGGVIDENYRHEWKIIMINLGKEAVTLSKHERVAQVLFVPVSVGNFSETAQLDATNRPDGGFGSSGKN
ncbi:MAG: dUTP diphosphatase [Candidatus Micrarchaeota archaeon]